MRKLKLEISLMILLIFLFFYHLGSYPLMETTDARYITISNEMVKSGDYIIPRENGFVHLHKPPFVYWMGALGIKIFGKNEFGGRFMIALFTFFSIWLIYFYVKKIYSRDLALISSLIASTSMLLLFGARGLNTDLFMLFFVIISLFEFYRYKIDGKIISIFLFWLSLAISMLVKGPIPILIIALVILAEKYLPGEKLPKRNLKFLMGILIFFLINFPWFYYILTKLPGLLHYFIYDQLLSRLGSHGEGHPKPLLYYLYVFPLLTMPWCFFLIGLYSERKKIFTNSKNRFFLIWMIVPLIFFSIPKTKLGLYVLPAIPPFAILIALYFKEVMDCKIIFPAKIIKFIYMFQVFLGSALIIYSLKLNGNLVKLVKIPIIITGVSIIVSSFVLIYFRNNSRKIVPLLLSGLFVLSLHFTILYNINSFDMAYVKSYKNFAEFIKKHEKNNKFTLFQYKTFFPSLSFYLDSPSVLIDFKRDLRFDSPSVKKYLIKDIKKLSSVLKNYPSPHYLIVEKSNLKDLSSFSPQICVQKNKFLLVKF